MPVASGTVFFPDLNAKSEALFFKYRQGWKARSFPEKSFVAGGDFKACLWNLDAVLEAGPADTVWITEGEADCLALVEAGIPPYQVLSVPNGARQTAAKDISAAYAYVYEALAEGLSRAKKIVWCGDSDAPGKVLMDDMAQVIGTARFHFVRWPDVHDANDCLQKLGDTALRNIVLAPFPWPQEGLFRLSELSEREPLEVWTPFLEPFEGRIGFAARTLCLVTGQPSHGKTAMFSQINFELLQKYGLSACVASFETKPKPHLRRQLRTLLSGKLEYEMSDEEKEQADKWLDDHYSFIVHPSEQPDLRWLLDVAETAVVRNGARIVQIDPWNRLENQRGPKESETEFILRALKAMYVFANDMNVMVQVIAHPAKMEGGRRGHAPELEDVSGSKHWENLVDQGLVVHRPAMYEGVERKTEVQLFHKKARFEELGHPCRIWLNYDFAAKRFVPLHDDSL